MYLVSTILKEKCIYSYIKHVKKVTPGTQKMPKPCTLFPELRHQHCQIIAELENILDIDIQYF